MNLYLAAYFGVMVFHYMHNMIGFCICNLISVCFGFRAENAN